MNLARFSVIFPFVILLASNTSISQNADPKYSDIVAQSFIKRWPNPDTMYCCGNTNHFSWQAGYVMFAMENIWKATGDSLYYNYIKRYVDQQVDDQGNIPDFKNDALDNFLPGYAILFMYEQTHQEKYKKAAVKIRNGFDKYPRNSNGLFWHGEWATNQTWVDGLFMGQLFLARYGKTIGESEYAFNEVVKQITTVAEVCQKENGLLWHGWDESKKASWADKTTGLAPEVWSEGLGWYAVLLADVFDYLPNNHPGYAKVVEIHQKLCKGLKEVQDNKTGMWCQVVDKPTDPANWNETSGTGMFIYLLENSIKKGFLSADEYAPVISAAYAGMVRKAKTNDQGLIDLMDCSSIGIQNSTQDYFNSPKEVSPFAAFGSFIISTTIIEYASPKKIVVWDGETAVKGSGWANPEATCKIASQTIEAYSGKTAVEFKFKGDGKSWLGCGWDWVNFQVGAYGTDITDMKHFTFWLKVTGKTAGLSFNLLCNGEPALDQPHHHTEKVTVANYCTNWNNGEWHQIIIPLNDVMQPEGFDAKHVAEMQFFNTGAGDGSFFIDDMTFDN